MPSVPNVGSMGPRARTSRPPTCRSGRPRLCPGRTLALLEMKVVLAALYRNFDVERVGESAGVREKFAFTMSPIGLTVKLHPR